MRATLLLAQNAQVAEGKLNVLGAGWSEIGPGPEPMALALLLEVPWDRTNEVHDVRLELLDADGQPVLVQGDTSGEAVPVQIDAEVEVGRPADWRVAFSVRPLQG